MEICSAIVGIVAGAVGPVVSVPAAAGCAILTGVDCCYQSLQEGKSHLRLKAGEEGWGDEKKHKVNIAYKEFIPALHRSGSEDVFPGY